MSALKTETILIGAGVLVAGFVLYKLTTKAAAVAGGVLSGNNALTQNQHNADGTPQTAYVGAGLPGTLGAAANTVSGGIFSSIGDWLGGGLYDLTHSDPMQQGPVQTVQPSTPAAVDKYLQGGNAPSGSGSYDMFTDPEGFGAAFGA
jgi:hypothetical protein